MPPKPDNFDAMTAAWDDPVEMAKQQAIYNEQLRLAGFAPLPETLPERPAERLPERFDDRLDLI